jgi:glycosyltransferase involved in cell wall biosynthesis
VRRVAAGWSDALTLGAQWVPNLVDPTLAPIGDADPDRDLLFVGTLRYPPNVDAIERLARLWPRLVARRPNVTAIIAGSAPTERVVALCDEHGWELVADFTSLDLVARRARVAVAPLTRVAGIQNKVLDAASLALPQVVTAEALEGFEPGIPLVGHVDDESFAADVVRVLDDPETAATEASALRVHVQEHYGPARWLPWAHDVLDRGRVGR